MNISEVNITTIEKIIKILNKSTSGHCELRSLKEVENLISNLKSIRNIISKELTTNKNN